METDLQEQVIYTFSCSVYALTYGFSLICP